MHGPPLATLVGLARRATTARATVHDLGEQAAPSIQDFTKPDRQPRGEPLASIVIPAYRARFFRAALASALGQSYPRIEIVVCDDSEGEAIESIVRECG